MYLYTFQISDLVFLVLYSSLYKNTYNICNIYMYKILGKSEQNFEDWQSIY